MSTSRVTVDLLSDDEVPTSFEVLSKSFGQNAPFINAYFPNHGTIAGQEQGSKRFAVWKQTAESSMFIKATTEVGQEKKNQIIGVAVWSYMKEAPAAEIDEEENVEDVWPDTQEREFMRRLWRDYVKPRTQSIQDSGGKGVYGELNNGKFEYRLNPRNSSRIAGCPSRLPRLRSG
jgi:hypothetical protein